MELNQSQLASLKVALLSDPNLPAAAGGSWGNTGMIAEYMNKPSAFWVWRTSTTAKEIRANGFVWTDVDRITESKYRIWKELTADGFFNPSKESVRAGIAECWGSSSTMTTAIMKHCKRYASRAERVFATGNGSESSPGFLTLEGDVSDYNIVKALEA